MNKNFLKLFIFTLTVVPITAMLILGTFDIHPLAQFLAIILIIVGVILVGTATFNPEDFKLDKDTPVPSSLKSFVIATSIACLIFAIPFKSIIKLHNDVVKIENEYKQKTEEKIGYYDKLWKTYAQKESLAKVNKETFMEVSKILMENRKDGSNLSWKWVQENQPIPFSEFTSFYTDLSTFIESERKGYFELEKQSMELAKQNNTLLETFPNKLYNKFLGLKHIEYKYGFTSDSTNQVFESGVENLK